MKIIQARLFKGDRVIWIVLLLLSLLSLVIVYSSTGALAYRQASGNTLHFVVRQMAFLGGGIALMVGMVHMVPVKLYAILSNVLVYLSIGFLLVAVAMKFAGMTDGSGRTIDLGIITFQPAEFAKIALIMFTAKVLGKNQQSKAALKKALIIIIIHTTLVCGLIFLSDFSTSALLFTTVFVMLFVGRIPFKFLSVVIITGLMIVALTYLMATYIPASPTRRQTVKGRIDRFINGDPNSEKGITQADYAKLAIYEGGFF